MKKLTDEQLEELAKRDTKRVPERVEKKNPDKVKSTTKVLEEEGVRDVKRATRRCIGGLSLKQEQEQLWRYRWPITT